MRELVKVARDGRPLAVRVYEVIRDSIVEGEVAADTQLVQEQIADQLGVSRTPVRDALSRLAHEGLVTWSPGNGYLVNDLTEQDVTDVFQVRFTLETLAIRFACGRHTPAQLARLRGLIEEMAAEPPELSSRHFELNRRFHMALIEPCGNHLLTQLLDNLWDHPVNRRITKSYLHDDANLGEMVDEHRELLAAMEEGDQQRVVKLAREHMIAGYSETIPEDLADLASAATPPPLKARA